MSNEQNAQYENSARERFHAALESRDWELINSLFLEMQDNDMAHIEPSLIEEMSNEELQEWKKWGKENQE